MEFSVKQAARSKHKHTQHLKRVHGGRGRGRGGSGSTARHGPELESNYDRYGISDDDAAAEAEGQAVRQSEGADLVQLLAESEQFYAQAHFRYRSFLDTADTEPPPVDVAALEQELALKVEPLIQALALLSPSELLGIEPQYLMACDPANDVEGAGPPAPPPAAAASPAVSKSQPSAAAGTQQQQQVQQQSRLNLPPFLQPGRAAAAGGGASTAQPSGAAASPAAAKQEEEEDGILQQPLSGTATVQQPPAAGAAAAAGQASSMAQSSSLGGGSSSSSATSTSRPGLQLQSRTPAAAPMRMSAPTASAPSWPAAAAAVGDADDDLDELLGLCGAAQQPVSTQVPSQPAASGAGASKKQSLEDWLDSF